MPHYPLLFEPLVIKNITAPNRLMMSAMSINFGVDQRGLVTEQLSAYLAARAAGGAGMILVGGGAVDPGGLELPHLPILWSDDAIEPLRLMVDRVRPHGACFGMQLMHGGRQSYHDNKVAPSAIPAPAVVKGVPKVLTLEDIDALVAAFGQAARRCREAGFDFIEIHAAHGYLINQFMSPNANQRRDHFGGSRDNRTRFLMQIMAAIQSVAGKDFPVGIRLNGEDFITDGWTLSDAIAVAPMLEAAGAAYLHVSAGVYGSTELTIPPMYAAQGCFVHLAEAVKTTVTIPVITVGRIKDPAMAEAIIAEGRADAIAMGRSFLADPEWPAKAHRGQPERIRPCIGCCLGCIHQVLALEPGSCVVNPEVGREYQITSMETTTPKRVLVLGAGPAGLAAAHMAARCGHTVTVWEAGVEVGGLGRLAAMPPGRGELREIIDFFHDESKRLGVTIQCNSVFSEEALAALAPDAIIYAAGSLADTPMIHGLFQSGVEVYDVIEVLTGDAAPGSHVVVLGGGAMALTAADFMAESGSRITVLNRGRHFAASLSSNDRYYLRERLNRHGAHLFKQVAIRAIEERRIRFDHATAQSQHTDPVDTIVLAERRTPIRDCLPIVQHASVPVHIIGDAKSPRGFLYAIAEAEEAARGI